MAFKSGFVNIVGNPNVGKSTLMNLFVGERISIATFKSQTTRHRIMGIVNQDNCQIVFSDTPGVLKPVYKLQESMRNFSEMALTDVDVLLYVTDAVEDIEKNQDFIDKVNFLKVPKLILINKIDLIDQKKLIQLVDIWKAKIPDAEIYPVSAKAKFNVDNVMRRIKELLPENPPYFEQDQLTDKPMRFFVSEIIREKILLSTIDNSFQFFTSIKSSAAHNRPIFKEPDHLEITAFIECKFSYMFDSFLHCNFFQ